MNKEHFRKLGELTALSLHGVDSLDTRGRLEAWDVESENQLTAATATNFYKSAAYACAAHEFDTHGHTEDFALLTKLANANEWFTPMTDILDGYLTEFVKSAAPWDGAGIPRGEHTYAQRHHPDNPARQFPMNAAPSGVSHRSGRGSRSRSQHVGPGMLERLRGFSDRTNQWASNFRDQRNGVPGAPQVNPSPWARPAASPAPRGGPIAAAQPVSLTPRQRHENAQALRGNQEAPHQAPVRPSPQTPQTQGLPAPAPTSEPLAMPSSGPQAPAPAYAPTARPPAKPLPASMIAGVMRNSHHPGAGAQPAPQPAPQSPAPAAPQMVDMMRNQYNPGTPAGGYFDQPAPAAPQNQYPRAIPVPEPSQQGPSQEQLAKFRKGTASNYDANSWLDRNKMNALLQGGQSWASNDSARQVGSGQQYAWANGGQQANTANVAPTVKSGSIKLAAGPVAGLVAGGAIRGARYTPALMKSLIALGVLGGAGTGALYWGANRHINEDSSADNEQLKTKIQEYDKIRRMMEQDIDNQKIRSADDLRTFARTY